MAVPAVGPVLSMPALAGDEPSPDGAGFERALAQASGTASPSPALGVMHELSVGFDKALAAVPATGQLASDPQAMVRAQGELMQSMTSIDILAKGLGSVSQSVNRLLTMQ